MPDTLDAVHQRAQLALASSPISQIRDLHVEYADELLLISGRVASFYHKQLAQEIVRSVADGTQVVNSVDVD